VIRKRLAGLGFRMGVPIKNSVLIDPVAFSAACL
jgi:hypothetical protein